MRAITQKTYGGPDSLVLAEIPRPTPGTGEVLIRVRAASVNAADWLLMHGEPYLVRLVFGFRGPRVPTRGRDVAGVVEALGPRASGFEVGDAVFAEVDAGSFADYTVAATKRLARMPANLSFEQAAAVPIAATTALQGLRDAGKVKPGDHVLINGASGGVGSFAVQIASALGAHVTAVCSSRNVDAAYAGRAEHVVDYTSTDFTTLDTRYDVIFDIAGNHSLKDLERSLHPHGTLVMASGSGGKLLGPVARILEALIRGRFTSRSLKPLASSSNSADLAVLCGLIESGHVTPAIERVCPLDDVPAALTRFGIQHAQGKIVILVSEE